MKIGEVHVDKVGEQTETKSDFPKPKRINLKDEGRKDGFTDDLQMRAA